MNQTTRAATAEIQAPPKRPVRTSWRLIATAPAPEAPVTRDRRGAQRGMAIILAVGGLFWLGVVATVAMLV